jgi:hypothetical protein
MIYKRENLTVYKNNFFINDNEKTFTNYAIITNSNVNSSAFTLSFTQELLLHRYKIIWIDERKFKNDMKSLKSTKFDFNYDSRIIIKTFDLNKCVNKDGNFIETYLGNKIKKVISKNSKISMLINSSGKYNMCNFNFQDLGEKVTLTLEQIITDKIAFLIIQSLITKVVIQKMIKSRGRSLILGVWEELNENNICNNPFYHFFKTFYNNLNLEYKNKINVILIKNYTNANGDSDGDKNKNFNLELGDINLEKKNYHNFNNAKFYFLYYFKKLSKL